MKISIIIPHYTGLDELLVPVTQSIIKHTNLMLCEVIVVANGCEPRVRDYVRGLGFPFKLVWLDAPAGYPAAINAGLEAATGDYVILLNNDTVLLEQPKHQWVEMLLQPFQDSSNVGISGPMLVDCPYTGREFLIFFCVMISREVLDKIGPLDEIFTPGYGEDVDFCIRAQNAGYTLAQVPDRTNSYYEPLRMVGGFPIYHEGEVTFGKVENGNILLERNRQILRERYPSRPKTQEELSNNWERFVAGRSDDIWPREAARYQWARQNLLGKKVLEIGCSSGYGVQFFQDLPDLDYTGLDYDADIIQFARQQFGDGERVKFIHANIHDFKFPVEKYDTIIAFEVIEHLEDGRELAQLLKNHCHQLLITTPRLEPPGQLGPHHRLHNLSEADFPGFEFLYLDQSSQVKQTPTPGLVEGNDFTLMLMHWTSHLLDDKQVLQNGCERYVAGRDDRIDVREAARYEWARQHFTGETLLEVGCSSGYGTKFLWDPPRKEYTGIDYDLPIILYAQSQFGHLPNVHFVHGDINQFKLEQYDTIVAFEVIEHLENGREVLQRLKMHCNTLIASVPWHEVPGFWGEFHKIHWLTTDDFPDMTEYAYMNETGQIAEQPWPVVPIGEEGNHFNLMLMRWNRPTIKLNLGCGDQIIKGYVNIDLYNPAAPVKLDIKDLSTFETGSVDEILACHVIEHISPYEVFQALCEWRRVLRPGGTLIIETPDILQLCKNFEAADRDERYRLLNCIYGTTQIQHPHLFGWYDEILVEHLVAAGFVDIVRTPPQFLHWGYNMRLEAAK